MIRIDGLIIRTVELDPVSVGITDIDEKRIGDAMATRASLDLANMPAARHEIKKVNDIERRGNPESNMVQPRTDSVGERNIVHPSLPMHPRRPSRARLLGR